MKQPITVTVDREHGNAGDVITTIRDAHGDTMKLAVPGDCSPYHALATVRAFLEGAFNGAFEAADPPAADPPAPQVEPTPATPEQLAGQPPKEPAS